MRLYDRKSRFTTDEFACRCADYECMFGRNEFDIDPNLIDKLNIVRTLYGKPMVVTSGARCKAHNLEVGGVPDFAHLPHIDTGQCRAVDIYVRNASERHELLQLAYHVGFERVGLAPNFVHLDVAWDLPSPVTFMY